MAQIKVQTKKGDTILAQVTKGTPPPGEWFTRNVKSKIGDTIEIENGLGLTVAGIRIALASNEEVSLHKIIGSAIQEARESRDMSQADLAKEMGISTKYIQLVEQGRKNITIDQLDRIAKAIGVRKIEFKMR